MTVTLHDCPNGELVEQPVNIQLAGNVVSSLHRVKDPDNNGA